MVNYIYAAAFAKCLENNLIPENDLRMLEALSQEEMKKILEGYGYKGETVPDMLEYGETSLWEICIELCSEEMKHLIALNDLHNIKTVFKSILSVNKWESLVKKPTQIDCMTVEEVFKSGEFSILDKYREICEGLYQIYKEKGIEYAEAFADKKILQNMIEKSKGDVRKFAELIALCADLRIYLRCGKTKTDFLISSLVPCDLIDIGQMTDGDDKKETLKAMGFYEAYKSYKESTGKFERYCAKLIDNFTELAEKDYFGFGAVLAYFLRKADEFQKIRYAYYVKKERLWYE